MIDIENHIKKLKEKYEKEIAGFVKAPKLALIQVGDNKIFDLYAKNVFKDCKDIGIITDIYYYEDSTTEEELINEIKDLQEFYDGVVIQLPLPPHINKTTITSIIDPIKDVDGLRPSALYEPAAAMGIANYLGTNYDLRGKDIVIIGRSDLVGKPLARLLTAANATVTLCHSKSRLAPHIYHCDLIVVAVGKEKFLNCYPIHIPVIDVGINFTKDGRLVGDTYNTKNRNVTYAGLLTRYALIGNVILAKERGEKSVIGKLDSRS